MFVTANKSGHDTYHGDCAGLIACCGEEAAPIAS
jgi:hypothetical protein